ncbi:MAG TPA: hypothetical protein VKH45_07085 [Candidatus Acidoferrum sp.]|nr:hypothetical protein [Candidatus Acidoferrum sp.]
MHKLFRCATLAAALLFLFLNPILVPEVSAAPPHDFGFGRDHSRIKHVFVIVLENEGYDVTFGPASKLRIYRKLSNSRECSSASITVRATQAWTTILR